MDDTSSVVSSLSSTGKIPKSQSILSAINQNEVNLLAYEIVILKFLLCIQENLTLKQEA